MKRNILIALLASAVIFLVSCDFGEGILIENQTKDSVIICYSNDCCIDSVKYPIEYAGAGWNPIDTLTFNQKFRKEEKLIVTNAVIIPPDSAGSYHTFNCHLFYDNPEHKGHFYVIKLEDARNHTWGEICRDSLYGMMVVTRAMAEQSWESDSSLVIQWNDHKK